LFWVAGGSFAAPSSAVSRLRHRPPPEAGGRARPRVPVLAGWLGYLRISTHPAIFQKPLTAAEAVANVDDFVSRPHVLTSGEADGSWGSYREV